MMESEIVTHEGGRVVSRVPVTVPDDVPNAVLLRDAAGWGLATNAAYLAIANPTNAQNAAQVNRLTRECNALIRLLLGRLDDTTGT